MTARLSLSRRVALIVVLGFLAVWLGMLAAAYILYGREEASALPPPERLSALATLVEQTPRSKRASILGAVETPYFVVSVTPEPLSAPNAAERQSLTPEIRDAYRAEFGGRDFVVTPQILRERFPHLLGSILNAVEFRIGLVTGETLVINAESPYMLTPSGLPLGFGIGVIGAFIAVATLIALHREFRPLSRLAEAVEALDFEGDANALPIIRARSPELRALITAFARLQDRIATLIRARLALVGGIQHDLRTFATRLRLRVDKIADAKERAHAVADIEDMIALLDDALLASRAGAQELDEELIELEPLVGVEVADRASAGAHVSFEADPCSADATVLGDRLALRRIVANLMDNALKYGNEASLTLAVDAQDVVLTVDDDGPGIPADQRALLLEPFTRLEGSRARRTGGAGLGLAVVRNLVVAHGGDLVISDAPSCGARLIVRLPKFAS